MAVLSINILGTIVVAFPLVSFRIFLILCLWISATVLTIVQRDATQSSLFIILQVHSTCFGCQTHPSSGVHKTVTTASVTGHNFCATTSVQRGLAWPRWR